MKRKYVQAMMAATAILLSVSVPATSVWAAVPEKEQTVYVNADENGNAEKVIVSNWLKNPGKEDILTDQTSLSNIQNVKGEETFSQDSNGKITWKAGGNDIYYQGETEEELPVSVKMTYFLDGKEIEPSELAGKSGKVKIRINYENKTGEGNEVCTPFLMVTGMILPSEKFTNVEVENGKVISDGQNNIVVGMGFPGLADSLKLSETKGLEDKKIPDYVEITADVQNFSLALTATAATTGTLNELGLSDIDSMDELQESLDTLSESSKALVEGSEALQDGIEQLDSSADTFVEGLSSADDGAGQLKTGIDTMNDKKGELLAGADQLVTGIEELGSGAGTLEKGVTSYTGGVSKLAEGIGQVDAGAADLKSGMDELNEKKGELVTGVSALAAGTKELEAGAETLQEGIEAYTGKVSELSGGLQELYGNIDNYAEMFQSLTEKLPGLMSGINGAKSYADIAVQALDSVSETDVNALSEEATRQAQEAAAEKLQAANAQQAESLQKALSVEGLTEEQKLAIQSCFGEISTNAGDVSVTIPEHMVNGNEEISQQLTTARNNLNQISQELSKAMIDESSMESIGNAFETLKGGLGKLAAGSKELCKNNDTLNGGAKALSEGSESARQGTEALESGASALNGGISQLAAGAESLAAGTQQVKEGANALLANNIALNSGAKQISQGSTALLAGGNSLKIGANTLGNGMSLLAGGANELKDGTALLAAGGKQLKNGTTELKSGSGELADGMKKFDEEGIQQLVSVMEDGIQDVLERLTDVADADKAYHAFDGGDKDMNGSVKFIIETAGIEE
ncbi:MAG: hypothetical protein KH828_11375 [Clostridiales bacterium]|nr:hypothetical protein [Clostridiales bacterium]